MRALVLLLSGQVKYIKLRMGSEPYTLNVHMYYTVCDLKQYNPLSKSYSLAMYYLKFNYIMTSNHFLFKKI